MRSSKRKKYGYKPAVLALLAIAVPSAIAAYVFANGKVNCGKLPFEQCSMSTVCKMEYQDDCPHGDPGCMSLGYPVCVPR